MTGGKAHIRILALDLGRKTGWATNMDGRIESGVRIFDLVRGESKGMLYHLFNQFLIRFKPEDVDMIVYEQTHQRGGAATEQAAGYATRVQEYCAINGIDCSNVHTGTLKKFWIGSGKASKEEMMAEAKRRGFEPEDDNEADALAVLHWAMKSY